MNHAWRKLLGGRVLFLGASSLMQALWITLVAKQIGAGSFGVYASMYAILALGAALTGFGSAQMALRSATIEGERAELLSSAYLWRIVTVLALAFPLVAFTAVALPEHLVLALLAAAASASDALADLSQGVLAGQRRFTAAGATLLFARALPLAATLSLLISRADGLAPLGWSLCAACVVALWPWRSVWARPAGLGTLVARGRGFWAASSAARFSQLEVPVVTFTSGAIIGAQYAVGTRVFAPLGLLASSLITVGVPELAMARDGAEQRGIIRRLERFALYALIGVWASAYPVAEALSRFLGPEYRDARWYVLAFVVAAGISGVSQVYQAVLYARDRARVAARSVFVGVLSSFALILVLNYFDAPSALPIVPVAAQLVILGAMRMGVQKSPQR